METQAGNSLIKSLSLPLYQSRGWMKLLGVLLILYGASIALTIVGLIVAWLPIWLGILLFQTASSAEEAQVNDDADELLAAMKRLKTYFTILGVLTVVLTLVGLLLFLIGFFLGMDEIMLEGGGHMRWGM